MGSLLVHWLLDIDSGIIFWAMQSWQLGNKTSNRFIFGVIYACLLLYCGEFRYTLLLMSPQTKPVSRGDPPLFPSPSMRQGYQVESTYEPLQSVPVLAHLIAILPSTVPMQEHLSPGGYHTRHWQPGSGLCLSLSRPFLYHPSPTSRLPSWHLASLQLEVAPTSQPLPAKGVQIKCRNREGPPLQCDRLRADTTGWNHGGPLELCESNHSGGPRVGLSDLSVVGRLQPEDLQQPGICCPPSSVCQPGL